MNVTLHDVIIYKHSGGFRGGRNRRPPPPKKKKKKKKKNRLCVLIPFCIRMLKNKAQIAREAIILVKQLLLMVVSCISFERFDSIFKFAISFSVWSLLRISDTISC